MRRLVNSTLTKCLAYAVSAAITCAPLRVLATPSAADCGGYTLVYSNGIMNDEGSIGESMVLLEAAFGDTVNDLPLDYKNALDRSNGFYLDVASVLQQQADLYAGDGLTWSDIISIYFGLTPIGIALSIITGINDALQQFIITNTAALMSQYADLSDTIAATLAEHVALYQDLLDNHQRVLIVAHSQGTIYANAAYAEVMSTPDNPKDALRIVSVAALVPSIADGKGRYVTSSNDLAVNLLRTGANNSILAANVDDPASTADFKGHGFKEIYMALMNPSYDMIFADGKAAIEELNNHDWIIEQPLTSMTFFNGLTYTCWNAQDPTQLISAEITAPDQLIQMNQAILTANMTGTQPDFSNIPMQSQRYKNPDGDYVTADDYINAQGDQALFASLKSLDLDWNKPDNVVAYEVIQPSQSCGGATVELPPGSGANFGNTTALYDSIYLTPELTAIKVHTSVLSAKATSGWPNKLVEVKVCQVPQSQSQQGAPGL